jgi:hypothetical protein
LSSLPNRSHQGSREHVEGLVDESRCRGTRDDHEIPARQLGLVQADDLANPATEAIPDDRVTDLAAHGHAEPDMRRGAGMDEDREVARGGAGTAAMNAVERAPAAEATGGGERERGKSHARRVHFL